MELGSESSTPKTGNRETNSTRKKTKGKIHQPNANMNIYKCSAMKHSSHDR